MGKKRIKLFEYDEAWIYCVLNKIEKFKVIKQTEKRKYGVFLTNKNKWIKE